MLGVYLRDCILEKQHFSMSVHTHTNTHTQTLSISVLHFTVISQQTWNDTSRPSLCLLVSRWMFLLCIVSHSLSVGVLVSVTINLEVVMRPLCLSVFLYYTTLLSLKIMINLLNLMVYNLATPFLFKAVNVTALGRCIRGTDLEGPGY